MTENPETSMSDALWWEKSPEDDPRISFIWSYFPRKHNKLKTTRSSADMTNQLTSYTSWIKYIHNYYINPDAVSRGAAASRLLTSALWRLFCSVLGGNREKYEFMHSPGLIQTQSQFSCGELPSCKHE